MKRYKLRFYTGRLATIAFGVVTVWSTKAATQLGIGYDGAYQGNIHLTGAPGNLGAGGENVYLTAFQATYLNGDALPFPTTNPFYTFCVDISPILVSPGWWEATTFPSSPNGNAIQFLPGGIQRAASIYNAFVSGVDISTANGQLNGAALQLAIWNDLYDGDTTVSGGVFSVSGGNSAAVVGLADLILVDATNFNINPSVTSTFWNATDPVNNQDLIGPQMETGFVPEPGTYAAAASAFSYLCLLGVRRKPKHS